MLITPLRSSTYPSLWGMGAGRSGGAAGARSCLAALRRPGGGGGIGHRGVVWSCIARPSRCYAQPGPDQVQPAAARRQAARLGAYRAAPLVETHRLLRARRDTSALRTARCSGLSRATCCAVPSASRLVWRDGASSNAARGRRKRSDASLGVAGDTEPDERSSAQAARRGNWAELIRRVCEVDPLLCPKCGADMRIVAFITEPSVMKKILDHIRHRARVGRSPPAAPSAVLA